MLATVPHNGPIFFRPPESSISMCPEARAPTNFFGPGAYSDPGNIFWTPFSGRTTKCPRIFCRRESRTARSLCFATRVALSAPRERKERRLRAAALPIYSAVRRTNTLNKLFLPELISISVRHQHNRTRGTLSRCPQPIIGTVNREHGKYVAGKLTTLRRALTMSGLKMSFCGRQA